MTDPDLAVGKLREKYQTLLGELGRVKEERRILQVEIDRLRKGLDFYAQPSTYHACMIMADRPAGAFADDFTDDHGDPYYQRTMPGKHARAILGDHYKVDPIMGDDQ